MNNTFLVILTTLLGGTNIWTIILYIAEKKKRRLEIEKQQTDNDVLNLEALKNQIDYMETLMKRYRDNEVARNKLNDEQSKIIIELKKLLTDKELKIIELNKKLTIANSACCFRPNCIDRMILETSSQMVHAQ